VSAPTTTPVRWSSALGRAGPLIGARLVSATFSVSIPLVLARALPLVEYGTYKQLWLVSMMVSAVAPLGMAQSLYYFLPRSAARRVYLGQTFGFLALAGAIAGSAMWLSGPLIARALSNPGLLAHGGELAAFTALHVAGSPLEASLTSRGRVRAAAVTYLVSDGLKAAVLVVPTVTGFGLHGMMLGLIAHASLRLTAAWTFTLLSERGALLDRRLFREQLLYALPYGAAIALSIPQQYAHQLIVAHAVGPAVFAIYAVGVFELPFIDLFYTPTGEVLMVQVGELDRAGRRAEAVHAFRGAVERLAALLLPPIFFIWGVAPTFLVAVFGARFAAALPVFRIALFVMPLAIWPLDAMLRARGETRHILLSYAVKAAISIPLAWFAVTRAGLAGAVASYLAAEVLGRVFLGWRLPASLSTPEHRVRVRDLVPLRSLARITASALLMALVGVGALHLVQAVEPAGSGSLRMHAIPLAIASCVFGAIYLGALLLSNVQLPGALGVVLGRRRNRHPMAA
jgi:O-antigen/teichoic acid export membrane protein